MSKILPEDLDGTSLTVAIAVSRFNTLITERLLAGAREGLAAQGVHEASITVAWVPGSFELPFAAQRFAETGRFDAVICLGCVIKGETDHNEYINHATALGLEEVGARTGVPAIFGVVTVNNLEQALARAGEGTTNKGYESAMAAVTMANLRRALVE
jgi:6,7-dimethyl-8-ribityllumazine synthase